MIVHFWKTCLPSKSKSSGALCLLDKIKKKRKLQRLTTILFKCGKHLVKPHETLNSCNVFSSVSGAMCLICNWPSRNLTSLFTVHDVLVLAISLRGLFLDQTYKNMHNIYMHIIYMQIIYMHNIYVHNIYMHDK